MTQPMEPTLAMLQNPFARYFAATRPAFLTASLMACLVGLAVAWHDGLAFDIPLALVTLLFALLAHAGVNVLNDYYDAINGTDAQNTERIFPFTGGSRFIQNGVLTLAQTRNFGFVLMGCVAAAGLWLMAYSAPQLMYVGLAGLFIGWAYSAPPFRLNSRGLGELCVAAGFLAITVGTDFVQRKGFAAAPFIAGLSYALLVTNLLYINQFPDRTADTAAGKLHWVARLEVQTCALGLCVDRGAGLCMAAVERAAGLAAVAGAAGIAGASVQREGVVPVVPSCRATAAVGRCDQIDHRRDDGARHLLSLALLLSK